MGGYLVRIVGETGTRYFDTYGQAEKFMRGTGRQCVYHSIVDGAEWHSFLYWGDNAIDARKIFEAVSGTHIDHYSMALSGIAKCTNRTVYGRFNDHFVVATPGGSVDQMVRDYEALTSKAAQ
jgi:hypothetical protein